MIWYRNLVWIVYINIPDCTSSYYILQCESLLLYKRPILLPEKQKRKDLCLFEITSTQAGGWQIQATNNEDNRCFYWVLNCVPVPEKSVDWARPRMAIIIGVLAESWTVYLSSRNQVRHQFTGIFFKFAYWIWDLKPNVESSWQHWLQKWNCCAGKFMINE